MTAEKPDVVSLSFVDVLANGFANIVTLFLIMAILQQGLELTERSAVRPNRAPLRVGQPDGQRRPPEKDPFVILVTSNDDQPLRAENADYRWEYPKELAGRPNGGERFASLFLPRPPADQTVVLSGLRVGAQVVVRLWSQGTERSPQISTVKPGGRLVLCPESSRILRP